MNYENIFSGIPDCLTLVIGDLMLDRYVFCSSQRVSPEAPVLIAKTEKTEEKLGGAGNVAENLLKLGAPVILIGLTGKDTDGMILDSIIRRKGFYDYCLIYEDQRKTTVKSRIISHSQQLLRLDTETVKGISERSIHSSLEFLLPYKNKIKNIILSDYAKGMLSREMIQRITDFFPDKTPIFADPKGTDYSKYQNIKCITPNSKEAEMATGISVDTSQGIQSAAKKMISELNLQEILITRSEKGMFFLSSEGKEIEIQSQAKEIYDVTGAGDTVISVFSVFRTLGASPELACKASSLAAALVISRLGAASITSRELKAELSGLNKIQTKKHKTLEECRDIIVDEKLKGKKIVFTNGCFDLLHAGHVDYLTNSKMLGDILVLGLNSDNSIKRLKGDKRPLLDEKNRIFVLSALDCIDYIVVFDEDTPENLLKNLKPDILTKGADYQVSEVVGNDFIGEWGGKVELVKLTENQSTSGLIEKIVERYGND